MPALTILLASLLAPEAPNAADDDPEPPGTGGPVAVKLVARKKTYKLDTGGLPARDHQAAIRQGRAARVPVELDLVITNASRKTICVQTSGSRVNRWLMGWTLKLEGPGAVAGGPYWSEKKDRPADAFATLKPGAKAVIPIRHLASHSASVQMYNHFWTEPGDYTLSVSLYTVVTLDFNGGNPTLGSQTLTAKPVRIKVEK